MSGQIQKLLRQLEKDAIGETKSTATLLRAGKALAYRLRVDEFKEWCSRELGGYPDGKTLPNYRQVPSQLRGTSFSGFTKVSNHAVPLTGMDDELRERLQEFVDSVHVRQSLPQLEEICKQNEDQVGFDFPNEAVSLLRQSGLPGLVEATRVVSVSALSGIVSSVREKLMELSLELQQHRFPADLDLVSETQGQIQDQAAAVFYSCVFEGSVTMSDEGDEINIGSEGDMTNVTGKQSAGRDASLSQAKGMTDDDDFDQEQFNEDVTEILHALVDYKEDTEVQRFEMMQALEEIRETIHQDADIDELREMVEEVWLDHVSEDFKTTLQKLANTDLGDTLVESALGQLMVTALSG